MLQLAIIILVVILLVHTLAKKEKFISYTASYSEYGPQPLAILTKYVENKMNYEEMQQKTSYLMIMEIFRDAKYKLYSDDSLVREGILSVDMQKIINDLLKVSDKHADKKYCPTGVNFTQYKLWLNGNNVYLGLFGPDCVPEELQPAKKLFNLMEVSDLSSYT